LVRSIDTTTGASEQKAAAILGTLIPFLLGTTGLQSESDDVRTFSLKILLDISKKESKSLLAYIPGLIEEFLDMLSTLEPQAMNYLALNADKYGLTSNSVDASRMASLRSSPMMEAIEIMIDRLDSKGLEEFVPKLAQVIKRSVGVPSKLGSSRVIVTMALRNGYRMAPFADDLLRASRSQLSDRNDVVVQSFAVACGYLCRSASNKAVLDYLKLLSDSYLLPPSDDARDRSKFVAAVGVGAFSSHASDKFNSFASSVLPLVFVGTHDDDKDIREKFETIWSDNTGGTGAVRLYFSEIVSIARQSLQSQHWGLRQSAAKTIADAAVVIGVATVSQELLSELVGVLIEALAGKSWPGKGSVVKALASVSVAHKTALNESETMTAGVRKALVTEVKRRNTEYRAAVIPSFATFVESFGDEELYEILFATIDAALEAQADDSDAEGDKEMKSATAAAKEEVSRIDLIQASVTSFNASYKSASHVLKKIVDYSVRALDPVENAITWRSEIAACQQLSSLAKKITDCDGASAQSKILLPLWSKIYKVCAFDSNHEAVRSESVRAGLKLYNALDPSLREGVRSQLGEIEANENSSVVLTELRQGLSKANAMDTA
jgi:proteasome component ECM29